MSLFCFHTYKPKDVVRGENLLGDVTYGIAFYCTQCNKRKVDAGWSRDGAERHLAWLRGQA